MLYNKNIVILGPTAIGKSNLAIDLALEFNGEIISADSKQIYKGFDIGSGKVSKSDLDKIPHYMIDIKEIWENFSVQEFQNLAYNHIEEIHSRQENVFIVGGTGLYIDSLVKNYNITNIEPNYKLRNELEKKSVKELQDIISIKSSKHNLNNSDFHNKVRLIRFIEKIATTSLLPSDILKKNNPYNFLQIGLYTDLDILEKRIRQRVLERLDNGAFEEVKKIKYILNQKLDTTSALSKLYSFGLGTIVINGYLENQINYQDMIDKFILKEFQYAKRQLKWFKRDKSIVWINLKEISQIKTIITK